MNKAAGGLTNTIPTEIGSLPLELIDLGKYTFFNNGISIISDAKINELFCQVVMIFMERYPVVFTPMELGTKITIQLP